MTGILLAVALMTAVTILSLIVLYAARVDMVPAGIVDPFHPGVGSDPSSDTLPTGCSLSQTAPPISTDWQVTTLPNLSQVEDLLDCLEARGVTEREVIALGNASFAVRWR